MYHKLSTSNLTAISVTSLIGQQQSVSKLMPNTPVTMVLYIISDIWWLGVKTPRRVEDTFVKPEAGRGWPQSNLLRVLQIHFIGRSMPNDEPPWFRLRGYLHFDSPVKAVTAQKLVTNPKRVAKHAFFPLIHYQIDSFKVSTTESGEFHKKFKSRPISYASHLDSHIYAYYAWLLSKHYEELLNHNNLSDNVLAFRSLGKSNIEFANNAFEEIKRRKHCVAIALDISGFFDNLDHQTLKAMWARTLGEEKLPDDHFNVFKSLTKYSKVNRAALYEQLGISPNNPKNGRFRICAAHEFRNTVRCNGLIETHQKTKGIPQGTPISALLSNIYMIDFDSKAKQITDEFGGEYYRYCDDMLFIVQPDQQDVIEHFVNSEIDRLGLSINQDKTEIRHFWPDGILQKCNKSLQYLGFTFDGQRKLIRSAALARFSGRMKSGVRLAKKTREKIKRLNDSQGRPTKALFKRKLYERYSYVGRRNFISYGYRAANLMGSQAIKRQLKPLWARLQDEIQK